MFIGHYAIAFLLILLFPQVPIWVPLVGVAFPDFLWGFLVLLKKEEVIIDSGSPLQKSIQFKRYPYSHSLVLTNAISFAVGAILAVSLGVPLVLPVFVFASASHWALDTLVHLHDLPVLGFDGDRKVGLGLWRRGSIAFVLELALFVIFAAAFVRPLSVLLPVMAVGLVFHATNANSFIGFSRKNPFPTPNAYAGVALAGFAAMSALLYVVI